MNTILKMKLKELLVKYLLSDYITITDTEIVKDGAYVTVFVKKEFLTDKDRIKTRLMKQLTT